MATLSGQIETSGARVPVRVERSSGGLVALTTTAADGSWSVEVEPGDYVIFPRWLSSFRASTGEQQATATKAPETYPPGSPGASPRARARRRGKAS